MNSYPELQPIQLRDEVEPGYEKAAWKPTWKCFCCHDTGLVRDSLIKKVIKNYVSGRHKPVKCNASNCNIQLGETFYITNTLDLRFTPKICDRLDSEERQMWEEWKWQQHEKRKQSLGLVNNPNITNNLRMRQRTNYEQLDVERRHQDIRNDY